MVIGHEINRVAAPLLNGVDLPLYLEEAYTSGTGKTFEAGSVLMASTTIEPEAGDDIVVFLCSGGIAVLDHDAWAGCSRSSFVNFGVVISVLQPVRAERTAGGLQ